MSLRWPLLALVVSIVAWVLPLVLAADTGRRPDTAGAPLWVAISYAVSGIALLVFIGLLLAAWSLRRRG